jgi:hypothetical protein
MYPERREGVWVSRGGLAAAIVFFLIGCYLAWFSWTQIARTKVFHVPAYNPPLSAVVTAAAVICGLVFAALGPFREVLARRSVPLAAPRPWVLGVLGALWAVLWYGLVLLAFGVAPAFPPGLAVGVGLVLAAGILLLLPRWVASAQWGRMHVFAVIFGTMVGAMMAGFVGFVGAAKVDLYFKIVVDVIAVLLMILLGIRVRGESAPGKGAFATGQQAV